MILTGEKGSTWRKTYPSATFPPQIPHGLAWGWTQAFPGGGRCSSNHVSRGMGGAAELWMALHDKQWMVTGWNESGCTVTDYCGHCNTVWIIFKLISELFFSLLCWKFCVKPLMWDMWFSQWWLWVLSSGMWCHVVRGVSVYVGWICGLHKWQISL